MRNPNNVYQFSPDAKPFVPRNQNSKTDASYLGTSKNWKSDDKKQEEESFCPYFEETGQCEMMGKIYWKKGWFVKFFKNFMRFFTMRPIKNFFFKWEFLHETFTLKIKNLISQQTTQKCKNLRTNVAPYLNKIFIQNLSKPIKIAHSINS